MFRNSPPQLLVDLSSMSAFKCVWISSTPFLVPLHVVFYRSYVAPIVFSRLRSIRLTSAGGLDHEDPASSSTARLRSNSFDDVGGLLSVRFLNRNPLLDILSKLRMQNEGFADLTCF
jgi:hypothetical protein